MLGVSRHRPVSASQRLLIVIRPVRIGKLCTVEYGLWSLRNPLIYIGVLHESYGHLRYKWLKNRVGARRAPTDPCRLRARLAASPDKCRAHSVDMCECARPLGASKLGRERPGQGCSCSRKTRQVCRHVSAVGHQILKPRRPREPWLAQRHQAEHGYATRCLEAHS